MHLTRNILRMHHLAPVLAWTLSLVLVSGQIFHCCRLNESIADGVVSTLDAVVHRLEAATHGFHHTHPAAGDGESSEAHRHPGCHGHAHSHDSQDSHAEHADGAHGPILDEDLSCLSESILSSRAIQPPAPEPVAATPPVFLSYRPVLSPPPPAGILPPPEITGSPPVYLRTLRILV